MYLILLQPLPYIGTTTLSLELDRRQRYCLKAVAKYTRKAQNSCNSPPIAAAGKPKAVSSEGTSAKSRKRRVDTENPQSADPDRRNKKRGKRDEKGAVPKTKDPERQPRYNWQSNLATDHQLSHRRFSRCWRQFVAVWPPSMTKSPQVHAHRRHLPHQRFSLGQEHQKEHYPFLAVPCLLSGTLHS